MPNDYFDHDTPLTRHTLGRAEQVNGIFDAIEAGFDKLPDEAALNEGRATYAADTGTADAYAVALPNTITAYSAGLSVIMKALNTNTGASTINVDSLGVKTIKRYDGSALQANDIVAGMLVHLAYDGTNFLLVGTHGAEVALAKNWAQGTGASAPAEGSAKEWATETGVVAGGLKGAKGYADAASSSASAASTSASNAATSEANAESHYNTFRGVYYGALASDPALDPNGDALGEGDWYFNTTTNRARIYDGSAFGDLGTASLVTFIYTAAGGETSLSGIDDNGNALAYTAGFLQVFLNGARLTENDDFTASNGTSITGLAALTAGDVVAIDAFSRFSVTDAVLTADLASTAAGKGAELVGYRPSSGDTETVHSRLRDHDTQLENIEGNIDFSSLTDASTPVDDADLMLLRQGSTNKKLAVSVVRAEFATDAETAQAAAEAAADEAEAAQVAAETARDTAFVNADVYADTAAGLAGTAEGDQFQVVDGDEIVRYSHDSGPVATEVARYPSGSSFLSIIASGGEIIAGPALESNFSSLDQIHGLKISVVSTATTGNTQRMMWNLADTLPINTPLTFYVRCTGSGAGEPGIQLYSGTTSRGFMNVTVGDRWYKYSLESTTGTSDRAGIFVANGAGDFVFEVFAVLEDSPYERFSLSDAIGPRILDLLDATAGEDPGTFSQLRTPNITGLLRSCSASDLLREVKGEVIDWETHEGLLASQSVRSQRPVLDNVGGLDFSTTGRQLNAYLRRDLKRIYSLPDSTVSPATLGGWTITGIDRDPALRWIASNDGRVAAGDSSHEPSIVILTQDWSRIISEIDLAPIYSGIDTVQGVAWDTSDDTIWFADTRQGTGSGFIRHIEEDGTPIGADDISLAYSPNGLAYDAANDRLFICQATDQTIEVRSCVDGTLVSSFEIAISAPDQLFYDGEYLWVTTGTNGSDGSVWVYTTGGRVVAHYKGLDRAQAIEGVWVDTEAKQMFISSDGGFHTNATPAANVVLQYDIDLPPSSSAPDTLLLVALIKKNAQTGFRHIYAFDDAASSDAGWGISWATGPVRIVLSGFQNGTQYAVRWLAPDAESDYHLYALELENGAVPALYIDGVLATVDSQTNDIAADYTLGFSAAEFSLGGDRDSGATGGTRILGFITAGEATDREEAEGWLAHAFDRTDLLPSGHAYKNTAPS